MSCIYPYAKEEIELISLYIKWNEVEDMDSDTWIKIHEYLENLLINEFASYNRKQEKK